MSRRPPRSAIASKTASRSSLVLPQWERAAVGKGGKGISTGEAERGTKAINDRGLYKLPSELLEKIIAAFVYGTLDDHLKEGDEDEQDDDDDDEAERRRKYEARQHRTKRSNHVVLPDHLDCQDIPKVKVEERGGTLVNQITPILGATKALRCEALRFLRKEMTLKISLPMSMTPDNELAASIRRFTNLQHVNDVGVMITGEFEGITFYSLAHLAYCSTVDNGLCLPSVVTYRFSSDALKTFGRGGCQLWNSLLTLYKHAGEQSIRLKAREVRVEGKRAEARLAIAYKTNSYIEIEKSSENAVLPLFGVRCSVLPYRASRTTTECFNFPRKGFNVFHRFLTPGSL